MMDLGNKKKFNERVEPAAGVLYIVGTPIGNLGDLSPRAKALLKSVSIIACEDTRHSGQLVRGLGAKAPLLSFHRHNTQGRIPKLLSLLKRGESLALISDAGLPGISDPGENLVSAALEAGHEVICIPGPCAATTALISSGLPSERFCFEGFLPTKGKERAARLESIAREERTSIIYESPHKLIQLIKELATLCGEERQLQVARELTKRHEQQIGPDIQSALKYFLENQPQGEFTLVLKGVESAKLQDSFDTSELLSSIQRLIDKGESPSEAARIISKQTGHSRRVLYEIIHKKRSSDNE